MKYRIIIFANLLIVTASVALGDELTMDQIIRKVLRANSKLTETQLTFDEINARRAQLKAERLPTLTYSLNSMELRQGPRDLFVGSVAIRQPATTFDYHSTSLNIEHQLFDYGNSFRRMKIIDHERKTTYYEYVKNGRELILKTQELFFQLTEAKELKELYNGELEDLRNQIQLLESLVGKGVKPAIDKIKFDIRLNDLNLEIMSEDSKIIQIESDLAHLMGEPSWGDFSVHTLAFHPPEASQLSSSMEIQNIPLLKKFESQIKAKELEISVIKWDYLPDVYIRAGYQRGSDVFDAIYSGFDKDWSMNYSLNLSLPLYRNRKAKLQETQNLLEMDRLQEQYRNEKNRAEKEYRDLLIAIQSDWKQYELYSNNATGQEAIYRYEYERYTSGLSEFREMAEARKALLQSKQALISLKYELLTRQEKLDVLSGKWDQAITSYLYAQRSKK